MARHSILQQFYQSSKWQSVRQNIIAQRGLICQRCGKIVTDPRNVTLHHVIELTVDNVDDPLIALNPSNVMLLCRTCHDTEHDRFCKAKPKQVFIVYGMPCSGKSTYVQQVKGRNDIVVDMNELYMAVTGLPEYDKPDKLFVNVAALHNALMDQVATRYGKWSCAWIVGGYPEKLKRERLAETLNAELVYCECTRDDAIARLHTDTARQGMVSEYEGYIDEWIDRFRE